MVKWQSCAIALALAACSQAPTAETPAAGAVQLEQVWRVTGLANPESAALSADGTFLYVTSVNGEGDARDGNGFISRVSTDGEMLQREFATGLNAPKGIVVGGDALYVADIDQLVMLDAASGAVRRRVQAPGAVFLNDLAFAPDGQVLMADSGSQRIYAVRSDTAEIWLEHELLDSINGLLPEPERLVVTTMAGRLLAVDYGTRAVTVLAEGLGEADGVAPLGGGRYLVSAWPGQMFVVNADGSHEQILDTRDEGRFLNDFLLVGDSLYQPHWEPSEFTAYRLDQDEP
jgi:DNA-binding beta-propeller fold protein YncE